MPMPDPTLHVAVSERARAKAAFYVAGDVAEAACKRNGIRHNREIVFVTVEAILRRCPHDSQRRLAALSPRCHVLWQRASPSSGGQCREGSEQQFFDA